MGFIIEDRVLELSTTTGTGPLTLSGAVTGFRTFSSVCSVNDILYYVVERIDLNGVPTGEWESGIGTYSSSNTLTRTSTLRSSNSNAAVSFTAGTKRVFIAENWAVSGRSQVTAAEVEVDFGSTGNYALEFPITNAKALTTSIIFAAPSAKSPSVGYHDELDLDPITVQGRVDTNGTVILKVVSTQGKLRGKRLINYFLA